jgi:Transglycosylase SLT domain/SPOR domain
MAGSSASLMRRMNGIVGAVLILVRLLTCPALAAEPQIAPADPSLLGEDPTGDYPTVKGNVGRGSMVLRVPPNIDPTSRESICLMVEASARAHNLPAEFFARVIWQESRFQADAVGPARRGGRAQGIAQFMPGTAAALQLLDPFDPVQALPKSAEYLQQLRDQFGNLGLAAAAYNAGPSRVRDWLNGGRGLPAETRNYVYAITGLSVDDWKAGVKDTVRPMPASCGELMALLKRGPNPFVAELERRVVAGNLAPWGVQLSAGFSRDQALASYARLASQYSSALAGQDPSILATTLRTRGSHVFYQVRVGAQTRASADALCAKIHSVGGPCLVLRNLKGPA